MHPIIKEILNSDMSSSEKSVYLNSLSTDIKVARDILFTDKYTYCTECDKYHLSRTFNRREEQHKINLYDKNNEYFIIGQGILLRQDLCCPEGHKIITNEKIIVTNISNN